MSVPGFTLYMTIVRAMLSVRRNRNLIASSSLIALTAAALVACSESGAPAITSISFSSSPASGDTYALGERVEVSVRFDQTVTAAGEPQVALTVGTQTRYATFFAWGSQSLYFDYTVQEADRDDDGISISSDALLLNGGTITAAEGTTDADLTHEALSAQRDSKVNSSLVAPPPRVREISFRSSPATGDTYGLGETVEVEVDFDKVVTATGNPQIALTIGAETRHATFSGWGRESLHFSYTVQEEDRDEDGISIAANALALNGGTITATVGTTDVDLTHRAAVSEPRSTVNGSLVAQPRVRAIRFSSSPARGDTYARGEPIEVEVEFDRTVTVSGTPGVALTIGAQTRYAAYSASRREHAYLIYRVQEDDRDEDGISIPANVLIVIGGAITAADPGRKVDGGRVTP